MLSLWQLPPSDQIAARVNEFLQRLPGPVAIHVPGRDSSRTRVLVTLAHGNEPSGLEAFHRWLLTGNEPAVDVVVVLGSVGAALAEPLFYHRMLPGQRDLNRCYSPPYDDPQGQLAKEILDHVRGLNPEAVIDLHNTSGSSPAFAVSIGDTAAQRALVALFVKQMIVTDLRLGSLMEQDLGCPIVTIEAGGSQDASADEVAGQGLDRFFNLERLYQPDADVDIFEHPMRLELSPHSRIDYGDRALHDRDITVRADIERFNFNPLGAGEMLAWLDEQGLSHLQIGQSREDARVQDYFCVRAGQLYPTQPMRLFMATTRPDIAASDCLFYFVTEPGAH